ncbi:MAG: arylsulfatase [Planctomycetales bacterium]|nr:arylsulfatase [Planctomycetales bacterium]
MRIVDVTWLAVLACFVSVAGYGGEAASSDTEAVRPRNVVFVLADDLGWNDVGYHNAEMRTPQLDRLAGDSVVLECHYVQPQCTPTRVATMTGRYPSRFGAHCLTASNERALPPGTLTMADVFGAKGYRTALCGKWHLGSRLEWGPNHYGFDHSYGSLAGAVGMYDHRYRLDSPFARTWHRDLEFVDEAGHATDLVTREAVRWIHDHADEPFFLYVPFHAVHTPLVEEQKYLDANAHIENGDRQLYAAAVTHMDDCVGRILAALDATGLRDETLIVFSSDNGAQVNHSGGVYPAPDPALKNFSSNAPLRGKKTEVYEGGMRVPALVHWHGVLAPGKVAAPLHIVDWVPTLAALIGFEAEADPHWDGRNIWPLVAGEVTQPPSREIYSIWGRDRQREAIRVGPWKILRQRADNADEPPPWQLYNLTDDPYEERDLADAQPERVAELAARFAAQRAKDAEP